MNFEEWLDYKDAVINKYQPEKILANSRMELGFILGGYVFWISWRYYKLLGKGAISVKYRFTHVGKASDDREWREIHSPGGLKRRLELAKRDADNQTTFTDLTPKKADKRETEQKKSKIIHRTEKKGL